MEGLVSDTRPEAASAFDEAVEPATEGPSTSVPKRQPARAQHVLEPWWRQPVPTTVIIAILAAVAPVTTALHTWVAGASELRLKDAEATHARSLAMQKQQHEIRHAYLLLALEKREDESKRLPVLRFLKGLHDDAQMSTWATAELGIVEEEIELTRRELESTGERLSEANRARFKASAAACTARCEPELRQCLRECTSAEKGKCTPACYQRAVPCLTKCNAEFQ